MCVYAHTSSHAPQVKCARSLATSEDSPSPVYCDTVDPTATTEEVIDELVRRVTTINVIRNDDDSVDGSIHYDLIYESQVDFKNYVWFDRG
jgi:hypothetical protein